MTSAKQPYISWKGPSTIAATSSWSRPFTNITVVAEQEWANANNAGSQSNNITKYGSWNRTRPIKHWRKQLQPIHRSGYSRSSVSTQDTPGSNVIINSNCCSSANTLQMDISPNKNNNISEKILGPNHSTKCISCHARIKPTAGVNTVPINSQNPSLVPPSQKYNFDTKSYLRSRNKSYNTNTNGNIKTGIQYASASPNGCCVVPIPYSSDNHGSQVRSSMTVTDMNNCNCTDVIIKPNNQQYFQQGAVSSSDRLLRLKYNTVNNNASSFKTAWGASAASAANYSENGNGPYFIKNKNNNCKPSNYSNTKTYNC